MNRLGRGLLDAIVPRLQGAPATVSERFSDVCLELAAQIAAGAPLPFDDRWPRELAKAQALARGGRIRAGTADAPVALVDLRGAEPIDPLATYAQHTAPLAVAVLSRADGGLAYTVGTNPFVEPRPSDLSPALRALAAAEFAHGPPALGPEPAPGNENWGGRATVFGSPWNYGSRLAPDEVVRLVAEASRATTR